MFLQIEFPGKQHWNSRIVFFLKAFVNVRDRPVDSRPSQNVLLWKPQAKELHKEPQSYRVLHEQNA